MFNRRLIIWVMLPLAIALLVFAAGDGNLHNHEASIARGVTLEGYPLGERDLDEVSTLLRRLERATLRPPETGSVYADSYAVAARSGLRLNLTETMRRLTVAPEHADVDISYELIPPDPEESDASTPVRGTSPGLDAVGLMINVAWGDEHLDRLLETLRGRGTATFFLLGIWAEKHPDRVRQIIQEGHEIAAHGHLDRHPGEMSARELHNDLVQCARVLAEVSGRRPGLYTPHYAEINPAILASARRANLQTLLPTADTADWMHNSPATMLNRVLPHTEDGALVLMHPTKATADFLRDYLSHLDDAGLRASGCEELLHRPPSPPEDMGELLIEFDSIHDKEGGE